MRFSLSFVFVATALAVASLAVGTAAFAQPLVTGDLTLYFDFEEIADVPAPNDHLNKLSIPPSGRLLDQSGNDYGAADASRIGYIYEGSTDINGDITPGTFTLDEGIRGMAGRFTQSTTDEIDAPVYVDVDGKYLTDNFFANLPANTNNVTYAAWINTTRNGQEGSVGGVGGDQSVFQGRTGFPGHGAPHFQLQGSGVLRTTLRNQTGSTIVNAPQIGPGGTADPGDVYPINEWFHYAVTYNKEDNLWIQYFNGEELQRGATEDDCGGEVCDDNLGDWGGNEEFGDEFFAAGFGAVYDSGSRRLEGRMDELYVFNRDLSPGEIMTLATITDVLIGDMNGDGEVNFGDLSPFALGLTDIPAYEAAFPDVDRVAAGDVNQDTAFNFGDLTPFADLLTGGGAASGTAVPEPSTLLIMLAATGLIGCLRRR